VDEIGHWFLMLLHVEERNIYLLDSYLVVKKVQERQELIKKIVCAYIVNFFYNYETVI